MSHPRIAGSAISRLAPELRPRPDPPAFSNRDPFGRWRPPWGRRAASHRATRTSCRSKRETCQGNSSGGRDEPVQMSRSLRCFLSIAPGQRRLQLTARGLSSCRVKSAAHMRPRVIPSAIGFAVVGMTAVTLMSSTPSAQSSRSAPLAHPADPCRAHELHRDQPLRRREGVPRHGGRRLRPRARHDVRLHVRGPAAAAGRGRPRRRRAARHGAGREPAARLPAGQHPRRRGRGQGGGAGAGPRHRQRASTPTGCRRWCCSSIPTTTPTATRRSR